MPVAKPEKEWYNLSQMLKNEIKKEETNGSYI